MPQQVRSIILRTAILVKANAAEIITKIYLLTAKFCKINAFIYSGFKSVSINPIARLNYIQGFAFFDNRKHCLLLQLANIRSQC